MIELNTRDDFGKLLAEKGMLGEAAEVGVAEGRNALLMLQEWGLEKLYLVDLWEHIPGMTEELGWSKGRQELMYLDCMNRLRGYEDKFIVLRGWSHLMAKQIEDESLDYIHLDATHHYKWVLKDLGAWFPKLKEGGIISGHDYLSPSFPTVKPAVDEFAASKNLTVQAIDIDRPDSACFWFEKE